MHEKHELKPRNLSNNRMRENENCIYEDNVGNQGTLHLKVKSKSSNSSKY